MELIAILVLCSLVAGGVFLASGECTICKDGWRSGSSGHGTCSWHGGIDSD